MYDLAALDAFERVVAERAQRHQHRVRRIVRHDEIDCDLEFDHAASPWASARRISAKMKMLKPTPRLPTASASHLNSAASGSPPNEGATASATRAPDPLGYAQAI